MDPDITWMFDSSPGLPDSVSVWQPFDPIDSRLLEHAHLNKCKIVVLKYKRHAVKLAERILVPLYWEGPSSRVMRTRWFWQRPSLLSTEWVAFEESEQARIENVYQNHIYNTEVGLLDLEHYVVNHKADTPFCPKGDVQPSILVQPGLYVHRYDGSVAPRPVSRYHPTVVEERAKREKLHEAVPPAGSARITGTPETKEDIEAHRIKPASHLVLVVHGIGEHQWSKTDNWKLLNRVAGLRKRSEELACERFPFSGRVEFIPVEWHDVVHGAVFRDQLSAVTLKTLEPVREFTNCVLLDAMFYLSPGFHFPILRKVASRLNEIHAQFCRFNPRFDPRSVSLIGHSLGSLVVLDLLAKTHTQPGLQLNFSVQNFFALGSPAGMFLTIRAEAAKTVESVFPIPDFRDARYTLHSSARLYNIFHPNDPIAYRLEPLAHPVFADVPPVTIQHHKKGGKRVHVALAEKWSSWWEPPAAPSAQQRDIDHALATLPIFHGDRLDYVLQPTALDTASAFMSMGSAHSCYFESNDCVLFLLEKIQVQHLDILPSNPFEGAFENDTTQSGSSSSSIFSASSSTSLPLNPFEGTSDSGTTESGSSPSSISSSSSSTSTSSSGLSSISSCTYSSSSSSSFLVATTISVGTSSALPSVSVLPPQSTTASISSAPTSESPPTIIHCGDNSQTTILTSQLPQLSTLDASLSAISLSEQPANPAPSLSLPLLASTASADSSSLSILPPSTVPSLHASPSVSAASPKLSARQLKKKQNRSAKAKAGLGLNPFDETTSSANPFDDPT